MRIEKVNDNQIRCTLTGEDLAKRQLKISELAYGTEKAKNLFRDMMQQASFMFGFDAENIPLMIEAIPLNSDCIVLIVTKVEDPEELDTRFSNFAPSVHDGEDAADSEAAAAYEALINSIKKGMDTGEVETASQPMEGVPTEEESIANAKKFIYTNRLYSFANMKDILTVSRITGEAYTYRSSLYQDEKEDRYYLFLSMPDVDTVTAMQQVLLIMNEYGQQEMNTYAREQYLQEHCTVVVSENALQELAMI